MIVQKFHHEEVTGWQWMDRLMRWNHLGRPDGRSMVITRKSAGPLLSALNTGPGGIGGIHGEAKSDFEVDVKDLLRMGRILIEKRSLDSMLKDHSSDINVTVPSAVYE